MLHLIDSHCHLDFHNFENDRQAIIERCADSGIEAIIVPGVTHQSWPKLIEVCAQNPMLHLALGLHPMFMHEHQETDIKALEWALNDYQPIAVGEIGLDFFLPGHDKKAQMRLFEAQIILADKFELPVILHVRKAHDEVLKVLRQYSLRGGIVHAFNGSMQQAEHYQKLGFLFGVGGAITYPRAQKLQGLFRDLPLNTIVLETDSPDMPLVGHQGERNSPERIPIILTKLAEIRSQSESEIAHATTHNCKQLFGI
ncbi:TatD family hydrolase [Methylophaga sp.]|uniref:TatD family hydrolase n=1 Tax=Methylophaga sp. TaxID=2024840 RepID=UPI003F699555